MDEQQFNQIVIHADNLWIRLEETRIAFSASRLKDDRNVKVLKWVTVVSGLVTGVSGVGLFAGMPGVTPLLTGSAGVLTSAAGAASGAFNWGEDSKKKNIAIGKISQLQMDVSSLVFDSSRSREDEEAMLVITRINSELTDAILNINVAILDLHNRVAKQNSQEIGFRTIEFKGGVDPQPEIVEEEVVEDGAEDIIAVARG